MKNKTATILIGNPGVGKSAWAGKYSEKIIISSDQIRFMLYGDESIQGGLEVWKEFYNLIDEANLTSKSIILDSTNCRLKDLKKLIQYVINDYEIILVLFLVPLETCLERNASRKRVVPEEIVTKMWNSLRSNVPYIREIAKELNCLLIVKGH